MPLHLDDQDRAKLSGELGAANRMAMSIVSRIAEVQGAERLLDITQAHIDSTIDTGDAGLEFAERLASYGAKVAVPSTLNVSGLDEHHWREWSVPEEWAAKAHRQMQAYRSMNVIETWTCAPYQTKHAPKFGEQIAWGESNAIAFANSVIGARTERYPDLLDVCAAITGRVPARGLHLDENRVGEMLVRLRGIPSRLQEDDAFYPAFGHLLGRIAGNSIAVIDGMSVRPTEDQLKSLGAAAASSGAVALFHIVGVTPEAPTFEVAFGSRSPVSTVDVDMDMMRQARRELSTTENDRLDLVVIGSPHCSLAECRALADLVDGRRRHEKVEFLVTTSRAVAMIARESGVLAKIEEFGARLTVDTCILATPMLAENVRALMTNSAKFAYYTPGLLGRDMVIGSLADCVNSAELGRIVRDETLWTA